MMDLQFDSCIFVEIHSYNDLHFLRLSLNDGQFMKREFSDMLFCLAPEA